MLYTKHLASPSDHLVMIWCMGYVKLGPARIKCSGHLRGGAYGPTAGLMLNVSPCSLTTVVV